MSNINEKKIKNKREYKGENLLQLVDDYVVVDIETTGLTAKYDNIIELGAVKVVNNEVVDTFSMLVNPGIEIDGFITGLTGITNEMVKDQPTVEEGLVKFMEFIGNSILVVHNATFDINFIYDELEENELPPLTNDFIDTMRFSMRYLKDTKNNRLKTLGKYFGINLENSHRALDDALLTNEVYRCIKNFILENEISLINVRKRNILKPSSIEAIVELIDSENPCFDKTFVFTGALEIVRKEAMQHVVNRGGFVTNSVSKKVNYLVVGDVDYTRTADGGKSSKLLKAEDLIQKGQDLNIIPEYLFNEMIGESND